MFGVWRSPVAYPDMSGVVAMSFHYTYIIESEISGRWYYGHTSDTNTRLAQHNSGRTKSTRNRGPWKLIFKRKFENKFEANRFELELKRLKNKEYIKCEFAKYFL